MRALHPSRSELCNYSLKDPKIRNTTTSTMPDPPLMFLLCWILGWVHFQACGAAKWRCLPPVEGAIFVRGEVPLTHNHTNSSRFFLGEIFWERWEDGMIWVLEASIFQYVSTFSTFHGWKAWCFLAKFWGYLFQSETPGLFSRGFSTSSKARTLGAKMNVNMKAWEIFLQNQDHQKWFFAKNGSKRRDVWISSDINLFL